MNTIKLAIQPNWIYARYACKALCIKNRMHGDRHSNARQQVSSTQSNNYIAHYASNFNSIGFVKRILSSEIKFGNSNSIGTYRDESAPLFVGTALALAALGAVSAYGVWRYNICLKRMRFEHFLPICYAHSLYFFLFSVSLFFFFLSSDFTDTWRSRKFNTAAWNKLYKHLTLNTTQIK